MRLYIFILIAGLAIYRLADGFDEKIIFSSKEVAVRYFVALTTGNVRIANELSDVPYSWNVNSILINKEQVEKKHKNIVERKGIRSIPRYTVKIYKGETEIDQIIFPEFIVYRFTIEKYPRHLDILIVEGESPKVIGIRD